MFAEGDDDSVRCAPRPTSLSPLAALAPLALLAACSNAPDARGRDSMTAARPAAPCLVPPSPSASTPRPVYAVQLAALADSERAGRLRDSLAGVGWWAYRRDAAGAARWRVRVGPSADEGIARRVAAALVTGGLAATVVRDSVARDSAGARVMAVHAVGGISGMSARVRWALAPDGCALVAVHDPTAVENEPVPNAFLYVREGGPRVSHERVWDVAVSPDWRRLAYGRAWVLQGRERDSLTTAEWEAVARETGTSAAAVRAASFPASGMAVAFGVAQPVVVDLARDVTAGGADSAGGTAAHRALPTFGGWSLRWVKGGAALALGLPPTSVQDDAPSTRWLLVDPDAGTPVGDTALSLPDEADAPGNGSRWESGPTIDISVGVDGAPRGIDIPGARVQSAGGWVQSAPRPAAGGDAPARIVGPGVVLAATAGGRFILALAPKLRRREYEAPMELVVYELAR